MSTPTHAERSRETAITVRYWAGARAAAGTAEDVLETDTTGAAAGELTLADVIAMVLERHPGRGDEDIRHPFRQDLAKLFFADRAHRSERLERPFLRLGRNDGDRVKDLAVLGRCNRQRKR